MEKKSQDFSMEAAMEMAKNPAAGQLIQLLRQTDSRQLQQILDQAATGNYALATEKLQQMLNSPQAQDLLSQLRR